MKKSINFILDKYENVKNKYENPNDINIQLNNEEAILFQLVQYFHTENYPVSLNAIVDHLENDTLLDAIQAIIIYVQKDIKKTRKVSQSFYNNNLLREKFYGQKLFSHEVEKRIPGHKYTTSMVNIYYNRGSDRVPNADLVIGNTPYWKEDTLLEFIKEETVRFENDMINSKNKTKKNS